MINLNMKVNGEKKKIGNGTEINPVCIANDRIGKTRKGLSF